MMPSFSLHASVNRPRPHGATGTIRVLGDLDRRSPKDGSVSTRDQAENRLYLLIACFRFRVKTVEVSECRSTCTSMTWSPCGAPAECGLAARQRRFRIAFVASGLQGLQGLQGRGASSELGLDPGISRKRRARQEGARIVEG